ncbi:hypothetical protein [Winogradskya consettensis]|uniref:hypothetical protein n=1 Tax=Winogradskya consettensis TaxID=113560 RepID=UPI001BB3F92E|nr:hypothetical protein [Actinoplanes consettensis]
MSARTSRLATWVFIVPALTGYVRLPGGANVVLPVSELGLGLLLLLVLGVIVKGPVRLRALATIAATVVVLFGLFVAYTLAWPHLRGWAFAEPAPHLALAAVVSCCTAVAYALLFYREDVFIDVFWKAAIGAIVTAVAAYVMNELAGSGWLVHRQYGTPRLQGLLSEPSAWAPFVSALLLLALARRRRLWVGFFLLAAVLTKSPTVLLSTVGSLAAWYVLIRRRSTTRYAMLAGLLVAGTIAVNWLKGIDIYRPLSSSLVDQFVVRLASGVHAVTSGGVTGRNDRFTSTQAVIDEMALRGWLWTGIGPGSEGYILGSTGLLPNALPVYVMASFGILGVIVLMGMLVRTIIRLRTRASLGLFLAFIIASMINSAGGWEFYKFVIVAVVVAGIPARSAVRFESRGVVTSMSSSPVRA